MNLSRFAGLGRFARSLPDDLEADDSVIVLAAGDPESTPAPTPASAPDDTTNDDAPDHDPTPAAAGSAAASSSGEPAIDQHSFEAGANAEMARHQAVFASEHYAGREAQANTLLGNAKLTSAEIVSLLATQPKAGGGQDMLAGMGGANPQIGAGEAADPNPKADAQASWSKTFDRLGWNNKN